jgi:hypothetical protein
MQAIVVGTPNVTPVFHPASPNPRWTCNCQRFTRDHNDAPPFLRFSTYLGVHTTDDASAVRDRLLGVESSLVERQCPFRAFQAC